MTLIGPGGGPLCCHETIGAACRAGSLSPPAIVSLVARPGQTVARKRQFLLSDVNVLV